MHHRPMLSMRLMLNERKTGSTYRQCIGAQKEFLGAFVAFSIEGTKLRRIPTAVQERSVELH
jgi:hypothetical protein